MTIASHATIQVGLDPDLPLHLFLTAHAQRGNAFTLRRDIGRDAGIDVLPAGLHVLHRGDLDGTSFVVAERHGVLVMVRAHRWGGDVVVSAPTATDARAMCDLVLARVPSPPEDDRLRVTFTDHQDNDRHVRIAAPDWADVAPLYPAGVRAAMEALLRHRASLDESRRLMVWYGPPGTGKTSAARALLQAWRGWADGVVVTDPEVMLTSPRYLRRVVLSTGDDERWTLVVLEDAESLLHTDTRSTSALGKLLNLADGMLGQGLRCLFLLTTNEPVNALHPALVRPGRCLARIEFTPLSAAETAALLGRPVDRGQTLAEVMATRAVATKEAVAEAVGQYL